jgi:uncharacterized glyoxalase superfamily protein PhnB
MAFVSMTPMLRSKDIKATIEFYSQVLQFKVDEFNEEWGWASLSKDGVELMVATPNEHMPFESAGFTGSFYFRVDDIESLWNQINTKAKTCYPLESFEYGMKEFAIYDNNGYLLQFGEPITN